MSATAGISSSRRTGRQRGDPARPVEDRVLAVDVEVDEVGGHGGAIVRRPPEVALHRPGQGFRRRRRLSGGPDGIKWPAVRGAATLLASSAQWQVGLVLGIVVVLVAATIVIAIVLLALRIAKQAKTAVGAVEVVRQQTTELGGIGQINDSGVRILHAARALRKVAVGK